MKSPWTQAALLGLLLAALMAGPVLISCHKQPNPRDNPDFVDTTDPSKVQLKPIGGPPRDRAEE